MGVILVDRASEAEDLRGSWWVWRPTLEIIRAAGIVTDPERLACLGSNLCAEVSEAESRRIAQHLRDAVLPELADDERVLLDLETTDEPDDGTFHRTPETMHRNYGVPREWLERFASFCEACRGFAVY